VFGTFDRLDERLETRRYLMGSTINEADWRLFTTLAGFDPVYFGKFECNVRRIVDYSRAARVTAREHNRRSQRQSISVR
jgi:putative glutathione S-transferase